MYWRFNGCGTGIGSPFDGRGRPGFGSSEPGGNLKKKQKNK